MSTFEAAFSAMVRQLPHRVARRVDAWVNIVTGLGHHMTDKVANTTPAPFMSLHDQALADMFHGDPIVRKLCMKRVHEALRLGIRVNVPKEAGGHEVATKFQDAFDDLDVVGTVLKVGTWENLYGGSVIYMAIDDGQTALDSQAQPVRMDRVERVLWLRAIDRTRIRPSYDLGDIDEDPASPTFGEPLIYLLDVRMTGVQLRIHRSRLIIFPGALTTDIERRSRGGWGISVVDVVYEVLQRNVTAWQSAGNALANAQYVVYKLKGLSHLFSRTDGEAMAKKRASAMELAKSLINAVLIDSEDEYIRENPNFGNMPAMLDQFMLDVAAAVDWPATVLWGRSPAGMNATGESDQENWYNGTDAYREHHLRPRLHQLVEVLMAARQGPTQGRVFDGWRVYFPALRQLSDVQKADVRQKISHADELDIKNGILLPQEVAVSRFRPEGYSLETQIDHDTRERLLKIEIEQREKELKEGRGPGQNPPEPEPEPVQGKPPAKKEAA